MLTLGCCMTGHIQAYTSIADGTVTQELDFSNVILNQGLKNLFSYAANNGAQSGIRFFNNLYLGTGTTLPTIYDLDLEIPAAALAGRGYSSVSGQGVSNPTDYEFWNEARLAFSYGEGVAAGSWTELGLGNSSGTKFTRALFRDSNGDPTTLTVAPDEFLNIIYTVRYQDGMGIPVWKTAVIGGQTIEYRLRAINSASWTHSDPNNSTSFWGTYALPFYVKGALTSKDKYNHFSNQVTNSFDTVNNLFTSTVVFDPEPSGYTIKSFPLAKGAPHVTDWRAYQIDITPDINKLPENRVTLNLEIQLEFFDPPVENFSVVLAGSTTLELSWDTLANATNYIIELRDSEGALVETKTVPAPGLTVTFETLTPAAVYTAILHAETSGRNTGRTYLTVSTVN